jgi:outer membrane protein OmpA-like peptidoglycan-associated protein
LRPSAALIGEYAREPLVLAAGTHHDTRRVVVGDQLTLHLGASVHAFDRIVVEADAPFTLHQGGDDPSAASFPSPHGAATGDLRLGTRATVLPPRGHWPGAAIGATVWLPTGDKHAYGGTGAPRFAPSITVGGEARRFVWGLSLSRRFDPRGGLLGSDLGLVTGFGVRIGPVQLGPEVSFSTVTDGSSSHPFSARATSLEALAVAKVRVGPVDLVLAGGPGIGRAPGTPVARIVLGASVSFDALRSATRSGPATDAGAKRASGRPPVTRAEDTDGDGIDDRRDACVRVPGPPTGDRPGCPSDGDRDGVPDAVDACPREPGPAVGDPARVGCPLDSDGDGVSNDVDACPAQKGLPSADPKAHGCPATLRVGEREIALLAPLNFRTASAEIDPSSFGLLEEIRAALQANPSIARVAVDGHTDDRGPAAANVSLSQRRALAVVAWLTAHGVDPRRTEARGFGPRRPVADNGTEEGRAKNRRVELVILRRTPEGEAGWQEGTVERNVEPPGRSAP